MTANETVAATDVVSEEVVVDETAPESVDSREREGVAVVSAEGDAVPDNDATTESDAPADRVCASETVGVAVPDARTVAVAFDDMLANALPDGRSDRVEDGDGVNVATPLADDAADAVDEPLPKALSDIDAVIVAHAVALALAEPQRVAPPLDDATGLDVFRPESVDEPVGGGTSELVTVVDTVAELPPLADIDAEVDPEPVDCEDDVALTPLEADSDASAV